jgi:hypothetical protein
MRRITRRVGSGSMFKAAGAKARPPDAKQSTTIVGVPAESEATPKKKSWFGWLRPSKTKPD